MNQFTHAAHERERLIASHRPPHGRTVRALRMLAILTTVIILWAASFEACYRWLAPYLIGQP